MSEEIDELLRRAQQARRANRLDDARRDEGAAIYRAEGDALRRAHTVRHVGDIHQDGGHVELAEPCYREALGLYRGIAQTAPLD